MNFPLPLFSKEFLIQQKRRVDAEFENYCNLNLNINISRGIPSQLQLGLSQTLLDQPLIEPYLNEDGLDCRNYGGHQGLIELRRLFSSFIGLPAEQIVAHAPSSLALMYECVVQAWLFGTPDSEKPWCNEEQGIAFICAVPGYDRHFAICEHLGIRMISVAMLDDGPDIEAIKILVANDASIKGMWCVPKYSNPTGTVYSNDVIDALASMPTAAKDFRLFWDNAYMVHDIGETEKEIKNIYHACVQYNHENRALIFASTSKMTLPGHGIAFLAGSKANINWWLKAASIRNVGPDKVNQLKQFRFLKDASHIKLLMQEHRKVLKPKFDMIHDIFGSKLSPYGIADWTRPNGGYFISLNVISGTAKKIVELAKQAGIIFSTPGACFPYGIDPEDAQLRIAPSYPELDELKLTIEIIATCIEKASWDYLIQMRD
ncbi:aminotransferase class I/II-fold pyridoxal phosphate-dependent enzyme [Acinetobacter sp. ANC 4173]|uniref:aminotransferase class I/II-fold pyridoxal phosphate-dependent enzyme n=1 Tax=Acinetobacter sp. ANC 4173 TaxID=2529837 RepID=UPI001039F4BE|nr:aminotransferase class I/II-fold pyridoxal phosphate-dependent enzyme [Acinetobacter sp. ANC 4173]TCB77282.1 aminotransferase class I/II-fold pyridoxal phosphate-dependent enzyme [Acinetobacter sp. ANC 4173]